jgi:hypothetical protein
MRSTPIIVKMIDIKRMYIMKSLISVLVLLITVTSIHGQITQTGDMTAHLDSIINLIPDATPSGLYLQPSSATQTAWRGIIRNILAGDYASAHTAASARSYQVVLFTDNNVHPGKSYVILERSSSATDRYWGTFVFDPYPIRDRLVIQCPHEGYDTNTGKQGLRVFTKAGARAYFVNGAHRCNGTSASPCDGTTSACSETDQAYRYSDQCHVVQSTFQITTEEMLDVYPQLIFIQPHGFTKETGDPDIIMSNGSTLIPSVDYLPLLRSNLLLQDNTLTFKICHLDSWTRLMASDNTQGRLVNGSSNPCYNTASSNTGRFIHLEQVYSKMRNTAANWAKLANAVTLTFPATGKIVSTQSGEWLNGATWSNEVTPTEASDVTILNGHTIILNSLTPECHDITFDAPSAYLEMEDHSHLTVHGDFVISDATHDAFAEGWSWLDACLVFAGEENQTLSGWGPGSNATSFRYLRVDKPDGMMTTAGNGMKLVVSDSLELVQGIFQIATNDTLKITNVLKLTDGEINNSTTGATLVLNDGTVIRRQHGVILNKAPRFGSSIDVQYLNTATAVTTGFEIPTDTTILRNLYITGSQNVNLATEVTVNGTLTITGSSLITGGHTINLAAGASLVESGGGTVQGQVRTTRPVDLNATNRFGDLGVEITASGATPGSTTVTRVTGVAQTLESGESVARYFEINPTVNSGLSATLLFHYTNLDLNGLSEDHLSLYSSEDGGTTWTNRGGTTDSVANTVSLVGVDSFSRWTLGPAQTSCCTGMVGNVNGIGGDKPSIGDVSVLIDALFISGTPTVITCLAEADVNRSATGEPQFKDLTIGDISILIDYLFISGSDNYDGGWGVGSLAPCK